MNINMTLIFITFIFTLPTRPDKKYYGKYYTDNIAIDHNGLDEEIKPYLLKGISEYQKQEEHRSSEIKKENFHIGVISVSNHDYIPIHSTNEERHCFDFYCNTIDLTMYMFGKLIKNSAL